MQRPAMAPMSVRYDVLDVRYSDGTPAVLRHIDGSGFAYYPSGRKAICISAHGADGKGKARRFSAIIHGDGPKGAVLGAFDEWGRGYADGQQGPGDEQAPKIMISEKELTVVDGAGRVTVVSRTGDKVAVATSGAGSKTDLALRLNGSVTLQHCNGRTTLDFQSSGIGHSFVLGELHGEEVAGMARAAHASPAALYGEVTDKLDAVRERVGTLKVDPSQKDTKPTFAVNTANLQDVLDNLNTLTQSLAHPNLAPATLQWGTERKLKKLLASSHPQCPTQNFMWSATNAQHKSWSIAKVSGKCTEERLANAKPTVNTPKSIEQVSQLRLPELIGDCAAQGTLLVVICLAAFAQEPSNYARVLAEKAHAELSQKFRESGQNSPLPFRLVAIELAEIAHGVARQYGVKEVPFCLMFQNGNCVHSKRLSGGKTSLKDTYMARPRVLLVEANPAFQFKIERTLRRNGYESDLAMDSTQALRLSSQQTYGISLVSAQLDSEQLRSIAVAVRRTESNAVIVAYNAGAPSEEALEARKRFLDECSHVFPFLPSYTGLAAVMARHEVAQPSYKHVGHSKQDFVDEILQVLEQNRGMVSLGSA